jgi:site-specific recombinase XerD
MVRPPADREPTVTLAIAGFLDACRSSNTRDAYRADLRHVAAWCRDNGTLDLLTITAADVARYRTACELAGASPATVARRLSALTSFGTYAAANGGESALSSADDIARPACGPRS